MGKKSSKGVLEGAMVSAAPEEVEKRATVNRKLKGRAASFKVKYHHIEMTGPELIELLGMVGLDFRKGAYITAHGPDGQMIKIDGTSRLHINYVNDDSGHVP